jgi:hypothetical protein
MAGERDAFVFMDDEGKYYVIPREAIQRGLISDDSKARLEESLPDTSGFAAMPGSFAMGGSFTFVAPLRLSDQVQGALRRPDGERPIAFA